MLFVKKCQSAFQARGKKADALLPRQRRPSSNRRPEAGVVGDTQALQTPLTSGFFSREAPILPGHSDLWKELQDQVTVLSGVEGGIPNQLPAEE